MPIPGEPAWLELQTTDMEKAQAFYGALFGWEFADSGADFGHYNMVSLGGKLIGGAMGKDESMAGVPDNVAVYLSVADVDATVAAASEHGGAVVVPPMQIGESGRMAFLIDPTKAAVGAWQGDQLAGVEVVQVPGAPCWYELMTNDYATAVDFYREVFGWDVHPMGPQGGDWQYSTLGQDAGAKAGICDASSYVAADGVSYWRVYYGAADCDATVEKLTSLGGRLLDGPTDTPFGRIATVTDDQGAMFQVMQELPR